MFNGKRFLITQPMIRGFNGSTLVALELATTLQKLGAKVRVYTCDFSAPASAYFKKAGIQVDSISDRPNYKLSDFDYVWVHSQILPTSLVEELANARNKKRPAFIFLHMSGMDWIPDEKPWIYDLENRLSDLSLFISEEVLEVNKPLLGSNISTSFFRNPAPKEYVGIKNSHSPSLRKLLIVSNHPPKEVIEAKKRLLEEGIDVSILGENQDNYVLMSPAILKKYDAVLTIAKTVPYCLVANVPVYVYDAYGGGPGWLNTDNFHDASYRNFSGYQNRLFPNYEGKGFSRKTPEKIARELIDGYAGAVAFQTEHHAEFLQDFSLEQVLPRLIDSVKETRVVAPFSKDYSESIMAAQLFAANRFEMVSLLYGRDDNIRSLLKDIDNLASSNASLVQYKNATESVINSKSYRFFMFMIKPYKKIRSKLRRKK